MPTALPARNILDGTAAPVTSSMKTALGNLRDYLAALIGTTGVAADARAALGVGDTGLKNRVINGYGLVQQRSVTTLTAAYVYGATDCMLAAAVGAGAVTGGTVGVIGLGAGVGTGYGCVNATWANNQGAVQHRIEQKNIGDMAGKTVTMSGKVYQDFGGTRTINIVLVKALALDDFSGAGTTLASTTVSAASGAVTPFSLTYTMGSTDAANGLAMVVYDSAANAVASKNFVVTELQLEIGAVATGFDKRPYGLELALCQRYYEVDASGNEIWSGMVTSGASYYRTVRFAVTKRAAPTITAAATTNSAFPASAPTVAGANPTSFQASLTANATGALGYYQFTWTASAGL